MTLGFSGGGSLVVRAFFLDGSMSSSSGHEPHIHHCGPPIGPCTLQWLDSHPMLLTDLGHSGIFNHAPQWIRFIVEHFTTSLLQLIKITSSGINSTSFSNYNPLCQLRICWTLNILTFWNLPSRFGIIQGILQTVAGWPGGEVSCINFRNRDDTRGGIHFKQTQTFIHEINTICFNLLILFYSSVTFPFSAQLALILNKGIPIFHCRSKRVKKGRERKPKQS